MAIPAERRVRFREFERPTLIDTRVPSDGTAERLDQLARTFKAFQNVATQIGGNIAAARGAREGAAAGAAGRPEIKSDLAASVSRYAEAYNNAATRSYMIRVEADLEDTAARLETEAGTDAAQFGAVFDKVRQQVVKAAPAALRGQVDEMLVQRRGKALARIQVAAAQERMQIARDDLSEGVQRATDRIANLRASDDLADLALAEEEDVKLSVLIDAAVADGTLSEAEGGVAQVKAQRAVTAQTVVARFKRVLQNPYGSPIAFIKQLKDANRTSNALPPDEEEKLEAALLTELREHNALFGAAGDAAAAERRERWLIGNRTATEAMLAGTLRRSMLRDMVANDAIDPDTARTLNNELESGAGTPKSDPQTLAAYEIDLLSFEEADIVNDSRLTWADKSRLVLRRREDVTGWYSSVPGKEANSRIRGALKIPPGTPAFMLSELQKTQLARADSLLYDKVMALPPEEREANVLRIASEVVQTTMAQVKDDKINTQKINRQKLVERLATEDMGDSEREEMQKQLKALDARIERMESGR
jgi:hypothetical protein